MLTAPLPYTEQQRLNHLALYDILDSTTEKDYEELVALASVICDCPTALISFVDKERQWFKAARNLSAQQTSRDISFCSHTILQDEVFIVPDTRADERFADNPLVTQPPHIGFYAGAPIVSSAGYKLGSVCVVDHVKKAMLTDAQQQALKTIAAQVSRLLELRLKNKMILEYADAQMKAEKTIQQLTLLDDSLKQQVLAGEWQQHLGQQLSAIQLYLHTAAASKELAGHFIQQTIEQVNQLIGTLQPAANQPLVDSLDYYAATQQYARAYCDKHHMTLNQGDYNVASKALTGKIGYTVFKAVQTQLEICKACGADYVSLQVRTSPYLQVAMEDDGAFITREQYLGHYTDMEQQVQLCGGVLEKSNAHAQNRVVMKWVTMC